MSRLARWAWSAVFFVSALVGATVGGLILGGLLAFTLAQVLGLG